MYIYIFLILIIYLSALRQNCSRENRDALKNRLFFPPLVFGEHTSVMGGWNPSCVGASLWRRLLFYMDLHVDQTVSEQSLIFLFLYCCIETLVYSSSGRSLGFHFLCGGSSTFGGVLGSGYCVTRMQ